jgi:BirA family biotin operon repressor/biotin-[acetyl-CoA-carboxylase] ligase
MKSPILRQQQEPGALTFTLLRMLTDGKFHSGEVLAQQLGISRASVSNALRGVENLGLKLYSVRGRGYCLSRQPQWLDAKHISDRMGERGKNFQIEILDIAVSSNTLLLQKAKLDVANPDAANIAAPGGSVLAVEWQSGGRGRLGRAWYSGLGSALTFSLLWRFDCGLSALSGLSLAAGVALIRALRVFGVEGAQLKWPNDVLGDKGKLAGILIETQGDMLGPSAVVIGIGLNLFLQQQVLNRIDQPVTSLSDMLSGSSTAPERNHLLAVILLELDGVLREFAAHGFAALRAEWQSYHVMQDQPVGLQLPDGNRVTGIVRGVADDGALELETTQGIRKFNVGEISLRRVKNAVA